MSRARVTIDRVMLNGLAPEQRQAVVDSLRGELSRLVADLAAYRYWARSWQRPIMHLDQIPLEPSAAGGRKFGNRMARAIVGGLKS